MLQDLRASQPLNKTTGPDCRPRRVSARQRFTCSEDDSPAVITSLSNWRMFWFNVLRMITGLHLKSRNYCTACVCVWGTFHLSDFFPFHPLIPVVFKRLPFSEFRKVCVDQNEEIEKLGLPSEPDWPPLHVDKHDSVFDRLLQPFIHTITIFIQLTDNERADLGLFTLCICFTRVEISVSLPGCSASCMCSRSVYKQEWSAVMVALFAQGLMSSVWMRLAGQALILFSQRGDWKWWKTQRANWSSLTQLLGRKMERWKGAQEKEEGNREAPIK